MTPTAAFASTTAARTRGLIVAGALAVAAAQTASLVLALSALADGGGWPIAAALSTLYFGTGLARLALAAMLYRESGVFLVSVSRNRVGGSRRPRGHTRVPLGKAPSRGWLVATMCIDSRSLDAALPSTRPQRRTLSADIPG